MAQIIKHRRGSLEALSAVTSSLVKGELVIASGSSNLTVTNGSSLVFAVPADGQVQAINRFLMGNSAPNVFGAGTYNGMMKGVPYYASGSATLYLLGSGGNDIIDLTGNISTFSSSVATSINSLSSSIGGGSIGTAVTQLNAFTASQLTKDSTLQTYTASVDLTLARLRESTASINLTTASLNTFTASENTKSETLRLYTASIDTKFSTLATYTGSNDTTNTTQNTRLSRLEESTASLNAFSASENTKATTLQAYTASIDTKFSTLATYTASVDTTNTTQNTRLSRLEESTASLNSLTSSYARTNSTNVFTGNQTITGSLFITQDLIVQGSSSIQTISSSRLDIGDNIIQLNVNSPSLRFGGIAVFDSGSAGSSGSFLYDSVEDEFIFVHKGNGTNVTSSHFVLGPETYDNLGNEIYLTNNRIPKGTGKEHLNDSNITDNGSLITLGSNTVVNGTLVASGTSLVSSSAQINYTQLSGISANIISASTDSNNIDFIVTGGSITANLKGGVVSGSSQIDITTTTGYSTFSSSIATSISTADARELALSTSVDSRLDSLEASVGGGGSVATRIDQLAAATASVNSFTASATTRLSNLETASTSSISRLDQLSTDSGSQNTRINTLETKATTLQAYTASIDTKFSTLQTLTASTAAQISRLQESTASLNAFSASENTKSETLRLYTSSIDTKFSTLATYTGSNDTTNTAQNNRLTSIELFTSSFGTTFSSSVDSRLDTLEGTGTIQGVGTANNVTFASLTTTNNVTIGGDLVVQGNTVTLNTATLVVEDKTIQLASGSTNAAQANGAGIEVMGANARFTYDSTPNAWTANIPISASAFTGSFNLPAGGSSKRIAFRTATGNLDVVTAPTTDGDVLQWNGTDFVMSNTIDGGSF